MAFQSAIPIFIFSNIKDVKNGRGYTCLPNISFSFGAAFFPSGGYFFEKSRADSSFVSWEVFFNFQKTKLCAISKTVSACFSCSSCWRE